MNQLLPYRRSRTKEEIEQTIKELQEEWKTAGPEKRRLLRARGILLRRALKSLCQK